MSQFNSKWYTLRVLHAPPERWVYSDIFLKVCGVFSGILLCTSDIEVLDIGTTHIFPFKIYKTFRNSYIYYTYLITLFSIDRLSTNRKDQLTLPSCQCIYPICWREESSLKSRKVKTKRHQDGFWWILGQEEITSVRRDTCRKGRRLCRWAEISNTV